MARLQAVLNLGVVDLKEERALRGLRIELLRDAVACATGGARGVERGEAAGKRSGRKAKRQGGSCGTTLGGRRQGGGRRLVRTSKG